MQKKIFYKDKIFLAGSTGMVGNSILKSLIKHGYGNDAEDGVIFTPNRKELDLLDEDKVSNWFKKFKPSVVIIAAAKVGGILANANSPYDFLVENLKIQTNIIKASFEHNVRRLLFLGSSCIYPKFAEQPIKEEELLQGELEKTNEWYAIAKIAGIKLCQSLRVQHGFDAISLMPTNLYGPKDNYHPSNSHVMAALIKKFCDAKENSLKEVSCWGTGNPMREFMHVDDLGEAVVFVLENWCPEDKDAPKDASGNKLYFLNVGVGKDISIKDLSKLIAKISGFHGEITWDKTKPDGTPKKLLNICKIQSLGWNPKIQLEEGIKKTIEEYRKNFLETKEKNFI